MLGMNPDSKTVVISPHPDDAVLSCWDVLTRPDTRRVVTVFSGIPDSNARLSAWDRLTGASDPAARASERREEDRRALAIADCTPTHLDFLGSTHRTDALDTAALRAAIRRAVADADVMWIPAAIGGHRDHIAARDAALDVRGSRTCFLYADLPYAARFGWPVGHPNLDVKGWLTAQATGIPGNSLISEEYRTTLLSDSKWASKIAALKEYRSQFAALRAAAENGFPTGPEWAYEVFWPIQLKSPAIDPLLDGEGRVVPSPRSTR
ncbi:PIG-L deacetylase family protein [Microbispora sp. ATCC PTA-5024]|uniref:PIG-L deacetylase family protein n=1 Tax=Microbispora sp. ATCC PTA-5024 TaxID=316330 RepID=UPI001E4F6986|nr:PIG-L family deacetylase [Microbispora sp. ATCC PTA-5024]